MSATEVFFLMGACPSPWAAHGEAPENPAHGYCMPTDFWSAPLRSRIYASASIAFVARQADEIVYSVQVPAADLRNSEVFWL